MRSRPVTTRGGVRLDTRARRLVDLTVGLLGLVLTAPVLVPLGLVIRWEDRGPAVFRQRRVGRDGQPFEIWKFRTMSATPTPDAPLVSGTADPRITRTGRWLRARHLDELPQLVNLVRGDMTLIGPRPEVPRFLPWYDRREIELLTVRPGIVGPGAILFATHQAARLDDADDPEAVYITSQLHEKLQLDLDYLSHRSVGRDLELLAACVRTAAARRC